MSAPPRWLPKATGYPIAKVAARIAIGYSLDEIKNAVTGKSPLVSNGGRLRRRQTAKWPFDKFIHAKRTLGTQMKATGEVMAIGPTFEQAIMKAVRGAEISLDSLNLPKLAEKSTEEIKQLLHSCDDERLFAVFEALKRGVSVEEIFTATTIDRWFLHKLRRLAEFETDAGKRRSVG